MFGYLSSGQLDVCVSPLPSGLLLDRLVSGIGIVSTLIWSVASFGSHLHRASQVVLERGSFWGLVRLTFPASTNHRLLVPKNEHQPGNARI
jgi:hypothetical protein